MRWGEYGPCVNAQMLQKDCWLSCAVSRGRERLAAQRNPCHVGALVLDEELKVTYLVLRYSDMVICDHTRLFHFHSVYSVV